MQSTFLNKWLEENKVADWRCLRRVSEKNPVVSVVVPTYQHAQFIERCVQSILMQETDFEVEIIIGEDDSSDGTRKIVEELQSEHSEKITAILQPRVNNYKINGRHTGRYNLLACFAEARGEYIVWCDGDDYFIDKHKLAEQYALLERNRELIGAWTDFVSQESIVFRRPSGLCGVFGAEAVWPVNQLCTSTTMLRREFLEYIDSPLITESDFLDISIWLRLLKTEGFKGGYIPSPMVNYTQHESSYLSSISMEHQFRKMLKIQIQEMCGQILDEKDFFEIIKSYDSRVQRAHRANMWGFRHLLGWPLFRRLLFIWKSGKWRSKNDG